MPFSPRFFRHELTIYPSTVRAQETGGGKVYRGATAKHTAIPAKIDFLGDRAVRSFGAAEIVVSHQLLTPTDVSDVKRPDVVVDEDGHEYRVEHVANEGDRDELWSIFANRQD